MKEESEKAGLKLNIQKMKMVASGMDHKEAWVTKKSMLSKCVGEDF